MQGAHYAQLGLLLAEAVLIAALMLGLYELRRRLGLALLYVGLGSFQFLQVVASIGLYVEIAPGVFVSPGSVVLFSANLFVVLILYAYEDVEDARQLLYGLVFSNLLVAAVAWIFELHVVLGAHTDLPRELLARNPRVLLVGTLTLFIDVIIAVIGYEALSRVARMPNVLRVFLVLAVALTVDSAIFSLGAFWGDPKLGAIFKAGAMGKIACALIYAGSFGIYQRFRPTEVHVGPRLPFRDLFEHLTMAQRVEDLLVEEERYALAIRGANDGLWDWDLVQDQLHVSERWSSMMGIEHVANCPPSRWFDALDTDDAALLKQAIDAHLGGERERLMCEFRVQVEGEQRWVSVRALVATDAAGKAVRLAGSAVDITEQRRAAAAKDEFVSVVSHELRTPVTAIRGAVTLLRSGAAVGRSEQLLGMAERNALRLSNLIDDLLDVQRIARGKLEYSFEEHDLGMLVCEAVESHSSYAEKTNTYFEVVRVERDLWVHVDAGRIGQVLANLLSNAAKFSPAGSVIDIEAYRHGGRYRVSVRDRGEGVPEAFRTQVFEKFTQAESANTRGITGTGLGLNISKSIVTAHGGQIGYRDAPGGGAVFHFDLPPRSPS